MDNDRPSLDLKYLEDICPDKNGMSKYDLETGIDVKDFQVPVIAVFTKYDQFRSDIELRLEDQHRDAKAHLDVEIDRAFNQKYLANLEGTPPYICLESEVSITAETSTILISLVQKCTKLALTVVLLSH
jgi:hypothetical protein